MTAIDFESLLSLLGFASIQNGTVMITENGKWDYKVLHPYVIGIKVKTEVINIYLLEFSENCFIVWHIDC